MYTGYKHSGSDLNFVPLCNQHPTPDVVVVVVIANTLYTLALSDGPAAECRQRFCSSPRPKLGKRCSRAPTSRTRPETPREQPKQHPAAPKEEEEEEVMVIRKTAVARLQAVPPAKRGRRRRLRVAASPGRRRRGPGGLAGGRVSTRSRC